MCQSLMTFLTAATFVAHGLFGCCWHHGHALPVIAAATHEAHSGHDESASHDSSDADECEHPDGPCHHEPSGCSESRCVFVRNHDSTGQSAPLIVAWLPPASGVDQVVAAVLVAQGDALWSRRIEPRISSAPLYARLQVWLI